MSHRAPFDYLRDAGLEPTRFIREGHNVTRTRKSMRLGGGGRFAQVEAEARASGARNPAAVAAAAGKKKYGAKKMAGWARAGRRRAGKGA